MSTTTTVLFSDHFLESSGVIAFNSQNQLCLLYNPLKKEYLPPKGPRNIIESRSQAALREFTEETGWTCTILPVTMRTRATMQEEQGYDSRGAVRREEEVCLLVFGGDVVGRRGGRGEERGGGFGERGSLGWG